MSRMSSSFRIAMLVALACATGFSGGCSWLDRARRTAPQKPVPAPEIAPPADYGAMLESRRWSIPEGSRAAALDPSGSWVAYVPWDRSQTVVARLDDGGVVAEVAAEPPYRAPSSLAFTPAGNLLAIGGMGVVEVVRLPSAESVHRFELENPQRGRSAPALAAGPQGRLLAATAGSALYLFDLESGEQLRNLAVGEHGLQIVTFSPDGTWLATYGSGQELRLWRIADLLADGTPKSRTLDEGRAFSAIAFDPSGATLAAADRENRVHLFDAAAGGERGGFEAGGSWIRALAFAPGGEQLIGGCGDGAVRVWNPNGGELIAHHALGESAVAVAITRGGNDLLVQVHRGDLIALQPAPR